MPDDAEFVALCDQDDRWNANKLEILLETFDQDTQLVYSDARIVRSDGRVLSRTFWKGRANNYTDLPSLIVANTITGAASLFRATLIPDLLPFPKPITDGFHDHWIALAAMVKGKVNYIAEPLYDYVQHSNNVIGHNYGKVPGIISIAYQLVRQLPDLGALCLSIRRSVDIAVGSYGLVMQKVLLARNLLVRFPAVQPRQRRTLERFASLETSVLAAIVERSLAVLYGRPTLNLEGLFLYSAIVTRLRNYAFRYMRREVVRRQVIYATAIGQATPIFVGDSNDAAVPEPAYVFAPADVAGTVPRESIEKAGTSSREPQREEGSPGTGVKPVPSQTKRTPVVADELPYPPATLMAASAGTLDIVEFSAVGSEFLRHFRTLANLRPDCAVLEVGCGTGRIARALTGYINKLGMYRGVDISRPEIEWCQTNVTPHFPNFVFEHFDVANGTYNANGELPPETFRFPFRDETFDFAFLTSVFTHMLSPGFENYLSEVRRILRTGGHCLITYFLLNEAQAQEVRRNLRAGLYSFPFRRDGNRYAVQVFDRPEEAVGYDETYVRERYDAHGLRICEPVHFGSWCGRSQFTSFQDIIVAEKR